MITNLTKDTIKINNHFNPIYRVVVDEGRDDCAPYFTGFRFTSKIVLPYAARIVKRTISNELMQKITRNAWLYYNEHGLKCCQGHVLLYDLDSYAYLHQGKTQWNIALYIADKEEPFGVFGYARPIKSLIAKYLGLFDNAPYYVHLSAYLNDVFGKDPLMIDIKW